MSLLQAFEAVDPQHETLLEFHNQPTLVFLSVLVAMLASMMALQMVGVAQENRQRGQGGLLARVSLAFGAFALGAGVWAMHFIGVLAIDICTPVHYARGMTLLSMLPSLGAAYIALSLVARSNLNAKQMIGGGALIGAGIGAMHYSGMEALEMSAHLRYEPRWFALSIVVAVLLAIASLFTRFELQRRKALPPRVASGLGGLFMGAAISGMHYTAMKAARFVGHSTPLDQATSAQHEALGTLIAFVALLVVVVTVAVHGALRFRAVFRQLTSSQARLESVVNTAVDGIFTLDEQGYIQDFNLAASRMFGWPAREIIGQPLQVIIDVRRVGEVAGFAFDAGAFHAHRTNIHSEVTGLRRDASTFPVRLSITRASTGQDSGLYVVLASDLSESKKMATALAETEAEHRGLIAQIPGVAFKAEFDRRSRAMRTVFVSDAIQAVTGWPASAFASGEITEPELIHPDDRERASLAGKTALVQGDSYQLEYRIIARDGRERWVSESASVSRHADGKNRIHGLILDITDSKLREVEFECVVRAIERALTVIEFDNQGRILSANDNFLALTGYSRQELLGQPHSMLCWPEDADSLAYEEHWAALRRGEFRSGEYQRRGKGNKKLWIQATYNPILSADGVTQRVMKFVNDLSGRRAMELDLRVAKDRAEQAAAAKSTFLANMSHEIRTPMNAIIGFTEVLLESDVQGPQRNHLNVIDRSSRALLSLLNDILDTAKMEHGSVQLECQDFSMFDLARDLIATLQLQARRKGIDLQLQCSEGMHEYYHGDALRVRQVLLNLLGNAVKFTEVGSVSLHLRPPQQGGAGLVCEVIDTGIGIPEDRVARIFEPFSQADASMTRRFGGTGLGTTIARQLTELMGGHISVQSTLGKGSVFSVHLPLALGEAVQVDRPSGATAAVKLPAMRILVVDDVAQNRELMELRLSALGHQVHVCENGAEALDWVTAKACDLVLMDVQMPVLNGLDATRQIRQWEQAQARPRLPIIALTASVLEDSVSDTVEAGMDGFVVKPVSMPKLHAELQRVLGLAPGQGDAAEPPLATSPGMSLEGVDMAFALDLWGSAERWHGQSRKFIDELLAQWPQSDGANTEAPPVDASAWAHRVRGAAANLGLSAMRDWAARIEQAPTDSLAWDQLKQTAQTLAHALPAMVRGGPQDTAVDTQSGQALNKGDLQDLLAHLRSGELVDAVIERVSVALDPQARQRLEAALGDFDFERAQGVVNELLESCDVA